MKVLFLVLKMIKDNVLSLILYLMQNLESFIVQDLMVYLKEHKNIISREQGLQSGEQLLKFIMVMMKVVVLQNVLLRKM